MCIRDRWYQRRVREASKSMSRARSVSASCRANVSELSDKFLDLAPDQLNQPFRESPLPPLHLACLESDFHAARSLLLRGAKVDQEAGDKERTPLHVVIGLIREQRRPLDPGMHPINLEYDGLMMPGEYGLAQLMELLLSYGADPSSKDLDGCTPLHTAVDGLVPEQAEANMALIKALVARGGAREGFGMPDKQAREMLKTEMGVDAWCGMVLQEWQEAHMALLAAAEEGQVQQLLELLRAPDPMVLANDPDVDGHTALHFAVRKNQVGSVRCLLERFADPNRFPKKGPAVSALHLACANPPPADELDDRIKVVQLLVAATDGVDLPCAGTTALQAACQTGFLTAAAVILEGSGERAEVQSEAVGEWVKGGVTAIQASWTAYEKAKKEAEAAAAEEEAQQKRAEQLSLEKEMLRKKLTEHGFSRKEIGEALNTAGVEAGLDGMIEQIEAKRQAVKEARLAAEAARLAEEEEASMQDDGEEEDEKYDEDDEEDWSGWGSSDSDDPWGSDDNQPVHQPLQRISSIKPTTFDELAQTRERRILDVQKALCIPTALVAVLLPKYKWDQDALVQAWYNADNSDELLEKQCGLVLDDPSEEVCPEDADCPLGGAEDCVSYEYDEPPENNSQLYTMLGCGHPICIPCWREVLTGDGMFVCSSWN
eukprot:TRINITY_DN11093_c0_g1_i3.p1 TRINITY_DN11093_c0_g1~~TRINITY_DN11093_c0_g1_i3.p1  ORF type:complete len:657 (+),score=202.35 TRINITY_DN11093_c0_g1_i3:181-2151(+)